MSLALRVCPDAKGGLLLPLKAKEEAKESTGLRLDESWLQIKSYKEVARVLE